ncbi:MAG TPA: inositol monophosphatase family protein [Planctomycetota bacterium]|nr:inositol monophosphatase family protein [Planctomycetota bacterium]
MRGEETRRALALAKRLALRAGSMLHRRREGARTISSKGGVGNIVTEMDHASERLILGGIRKSFPRHAIVAEESGEHGDAECKWYVDPLDGTVNYSHAFPLWSVSIAFEVRGRMEAGVVYCPGLGDLYEARRGAGAKRNGKAIRVSKANRLDRALLVSGFPYNWKLKIQALKAWGAFVRRAQAIRRLGSAALDLCLVADGRLDGFWERGLGSWDLAAGVLIAREAGAVVTGLHGRPFDLFGGDVLAANATIHRQMDAVFKTLGKR